MRVSYNAVKLDDEDNSITFYIYHDPGEQVRTWACGSVYMIVFVLFCGDRLVDGCVVCVCVCALLDIQ